MTPFYQAMQEVLEWSRYDVLTGRSIDYQQFIIEAIEGVVASILEFLRLNTSDTAEYNLQAITSVFIMAVALLFLGVSTWSISLLLKRKWLNAQQEFSVSALFDDVAHKRFTFSELLLLSQEHAKKKQLREAARYRYIAVLVCLDNKKVIIVDKSKTNAQLIKELSLAAPTLLDSFVSVVDLFQQTWFGKKDIDEDEYRHFAVSAEELLDET